VKSTVGVGVIGFGKVGSEVVRLLVEGIEGTGFRLELRRVADLDITTPRGVEVPRRALTTRAEEVVGAEDVDIVVELIGGIEPARSFLLEAIQRGKDVVTANKALLAQCGDELFQAAWERMVDVGFEASVGGGIPLIRAIREGLAEERIERLYGILNGTTNYILTRMEEDGLSFEKALREAQEAGYAEADPSLDVSGRDTLQKLVVLLRVAFGMSVALEEVFCEGIERITPQDLEYAEEFGYKVKLLAVAHRVGERVEARVHPALVPQRAMLANVREEFNALELVGKGVGHQLFYGKGAGGRPTARAVVADVVALAGRRLSGATPRVRSLLKNSGLKLLPMKDVILPYYFRFLALDRPGVLAQISRVLAEEGISISSVIQKGRAEEAVPVVMMTHEAKQEAVRRAVARIDRLEVIRGRTQVIRVEELC